MSVTAGAQHVDQRSPRTDVQPIAVHLADDDALGLFHHAVVDRNPGQRRINLSDDCVTIRRIRLRQARELLEIFGKMLLELIDDRPCPPH